MREVGKGTPHLSRSIRERPIHTWWDRGGGTSAGQNGWRRPGASTVVGWRPAGVGAFPWLIPGAATREGGLRKRIEEGERREGVDKAGVQVVQFA